MLALGLGQPSKLPSIEAGPCFPLAAREGGGGGCSELRVHFDGRICTNTGSDVSRSWVYRREGRGVKMSNPGGRAASNMPEEGVEFWERAFDNP